MRLLLLHLRNNGVRNAKHPLEIVRQYPYAFSWREALSTASKSSKHPLSGSGKNSPSSVQSVGSQGSAPSGTPPGSRSQTLKLLFGSAAVVAAITTAFYVGLPGSIFTDESKREHTDLLNNEIKQSDVKTSDVDYNDHQNVEDSTHSKEDLTSSSFSQEKEQVAEKEMKRSDESDEVPTNYTSQENEQVIKEEIKQNDISPEVHSIQDESEDMQQERTTQDSGFHKDNEVNGNIENVLPFLNDDMQEVKTIDSSNTTKDDTASDDAMPQYKSSPEDVFQMKHLENAHMTKVAESKDGKQEVVAGHTLNTSKDSDTLAEPHDHIAASKAEESQDEKLENTLSDTYLLQKENEHTSQSLLNEEDRDSNSVFEQKEELNKEKEKAAAALRSFHEKAEERLKSELRRKEEEADMKLKKEQLLAKAETTAAFALEMSSHLNGMADANIQIDALRTAFYARSEEARQSHSVHKLALGTFALENALMKGAPLHKEVSVLRASVEGIDKDTLLDVALSSLPPETLTEGTKTQAQLHQKLDSLKGALRELALIPSSGGGILTYALARFASAVKVKEDGFHSEGIESLISHVERCLVEGRLIEAANALEKGTQGSKAESLAAEWARQVRNRVVTEQTMSLLQAYATTVASSLA
ncbi:MICOS complex subunit MIC60, mitochondrial isoform X2 [Cryptomeria japonica]|uniref:MICOS complex subunit MIC60, mitochondrial isoform X2 n=1 Tax=Cryptomeria japonica TaxID=3369 RepID=UPI0027DA470A|nr:MICOS complex subunit MIC60, mitochondrial isoform X2 [Cryptomeria japonica]